MFSKKKSQLKVSIFISTTFQITFVLRWVVLLDKCCMSRTRQKKKQRKIERFQSKIWHQIKKSHEKGTEKFNITVILDFILFLAFMSWTKIILDLSLTHRQISGRFRLLLLVLSDRNHQVDCHYCACWVRIWVSVWVVYSLSVLQFSHAYR